jgi:hypothetical protein
MFLNDYPEDYDWISEDNQKTILKYFNNLQERADKYDNAHLLATDEETQNNYLELYNSVQDTLIGAKNILNMFNVYVEFGFPYKDAEGNVVFPNDWDLITKERADLYNEVEHECNHETSTLSWPFPGYNK